MEQKYLRKCPLCGAELKGEEKKDELLNEVNQLKEKGILQQTMFVAVKIVQSMSDRNPAWLKETLNQTIQVQREALNQQTGKINDSISKKLTEEMRLILKSIAEINGNPLAIGKLQEESIVKRLSSLKTGQDRFKTEKSRKAQEDVECLVIENGVEIGKMVLESKRTKKWRDEYLEQTKKYMEREETEFGILATSVMPDDALNHTIWKDGVLVVDVDYVEPAYIFLREHLKLKKSLEEKYNVQVEQLAARDQVMEKIREAIECGDLDSIINQVIQTTEGIDDTLSKVETYLSTRFKKLRKDSKKIRTLANRLINEHIKKIRNQLIQQPPPSFFP